MDDISCFVYHVEDVVTFPMRFKYEEKQLLPVSFRKHEVSFGYNNLINPFFDQQFLMTVQSPWKGKKERERLYYYVDCDNNSMTKALLLKSIY